MLSLPDLPVDKKLRSTPCCFPSYVRFVNFTKYIVNIYWLDYEGNRKLYNTLGPNDFLDVNTYETHVWIFEDRHTGDRIMGEWTFVFSPETVLKEVRKGEPRDPRLRGHDDSVRRIVPLTYPLYSLRARAMQVVRDTISINLDHVDKLELPKSIKMDLSVLVKKKCCTLRHIANCNQCFSYSIP